MVKRDACSSLESSLKRQCCRSMETLPDDVVELILERLSVESLVKFKSVCKSWKSTIESQRFQEQQYIRRKHSRGEDVLFVSVRDYTDSSFESEKRRIVLGSSVFHTIRFPVSASEVCHDSCEGLVCISDVYTPSFVINPATGWSRSFPLCNYQQLRYQQLQKLRKDRFKEDDDHDDVPCPKLGFGKDKLRGTYKPVWLYNSSEFGLENVTTCEVFDFGTNAWRYVFPAAPYRIVSFDKPVYLDGSLYWLSECEETKVLSFDLHTETFQVISKTPFDHESEPVLSVLDNRLCISMEKCFDRHIFSLGGNNTWEKMFLVDVIMDTVHLFGSPACTVIPVAILEKNKLLLGAQRKRNKHLIRLVIHDLHKKTYDLFYETATIGYCVNYFQSLFTV